MINDLLDKLEEANRIFGNTIAFANNRPENHADVELCRAAVDAEIKRLLDANEALRKAQDYVYIGRDGKSVQARDLEDRFIAALAEIEELKGLLEE